MKAQNPSKQVNQVHELKELKPSELICVQGGSSSGDIDDGEHHGIHRKK